MMPVAMDIPWKKYAVIAYLAKHSVENDYQFGKTALLKVIYLLQELYNVDLGYQFSLYTYGPFTSEVLYDLDVAESLEAVKVVPREEMGYTILPNKPENLIQKEKDFINQYKSEIDNLLTQFGNFTAKELELRSTIVYVDRDFKLNKKKQHTEKKIASKVQEIKPKFSISEIETAMKELHKKAFILQS